MFNTIQTALSGLTASTKRVDASAQNIANMNTTGSLTDPDNAPYTPVTTVQKAGSDERGGGVFAQNVPIDQPFVPTYGPDSPFANEDGIVGAPNINLAAELVNLKIAEYTFAANASVLETTSELTSELLDVLDTDA